MAKSKNAFEKKAHNENDSVSTALDLVNRSNLSPFERAVVVSLVRIGETLDKIEDAISEKPKGS